MTVTGGNGGGSGQQGTSNISTQNLSNNISTMSTRTSSSGTGTNITDASNGETVATKNVDSSYESPLGVSNSEGSSVSSTETTDAPFDGATALGVLAVAAVAGASVYVVSKQSTE